MHQRTPAISTATVTFNKLYHLFDFTPDRTAQFDMGNVFSKPTKIDILTILFLVHKE